MCADLRPISNFGSRGGAHTTACTGGNPWTDNVQQATGGPAQRRPRTIRRSQAGPVKAKILEPGPPHQVVQTAPGVFVKMFRRRDHDPAEPT